MQEFNITISKQNGELEEIIANDNMTLEQIAGEYQQEYEDDIILAIFNGKLRELSKNIDREGELSFVTVAQRDGKKTYRRSVLLLLQKAIQIIYGSESCLKVKHSLGEGYYCEVYSLNEPVNEVTIGDRLKLDNKAINSIKECMDTLVEKDIPIIKSSVKTEAAEEMFYERGMLDKARLFKYRRSSRVNLYNLDGVFDYFYGFMAPSTGMLKYFELEEYEDGFVILFPGKESRKVHPLNTSGKLFETLNSSSDILAALRKEVKKADTPQYFQIYIYSKLLCFYHTESVHLSADNTYKSNIFIYFHNPIIKIKKFFVRKSLIW